jgi:hypothetical protein
VELAGNSTDFVVFTMIDFFSPVQLLDTKSGNDIIEEGEKKKEEDEDSDDDNHGSKCAFGGSPHFQTSVERQWDGIII